eukprot:TRINITY_DN977_c0_g1_i1.p1 TRINITY_DN977_c0_g1~~TRINITY_DN977_c0_g1_i1.p1  ORF type:complete len:279 (+),score=27.63 TRINITY_DN977_c0_g1_i1:46-882(+)
MIQVDVFWSYAMGAFFACCAGPLLSKHKNTTENWYFAYTAIFLSCIFAPSGVFLLNRNPGWETMFVFDHHSFGEKSLLAAFIPTAFGCTNTLLGLIGFWVSHKLMRSNKRWLATYFFMSSYMGMFSILGFGYGRFLFQGTIDDWRAGKQCHIETIFSFEITRVILAMGLFVGPGLLYPILSWRSQLPTALIKQDRNVIFSTLIVNLILITLGYEAYLQYFGDVEKQRILHGQGCHIYYEKEMGVYAPAIMNVIFNVCCTVVFVCPAFIVSGKKVQKEE